MNGSQVVYGSSTPLVVPLKTNGRSKFHPKTLRAFSVINIILGLISCVLMTAIIVPFSGGFSFSGYGSIDVVGHGLWAGVFYLITGFLGYSASYKATNGLMVSTLVFSVFSMLSAITASVLSGIMGGDVWWSRPCYYYEWTDGWYNYVRNYYTCDVWTSLEYSLLGFSVLAWIANIVVLSVTSATVCCSKKPPKNQMPYFVVPNANPTMGANGLWNNNNQFTSTQPAVSVVQSDQFLQQQQPLQQQFLQQQFLQQHNLQQQLHQQQHLQQQFPQQQVPQQQLPQQQVPQQQLPQQQVPQQQASTQSTHQEEQKPLPSSKSEKY